MSLQQIVPRPLLFKLMLQSAPPPPRSGQGTSLGVIICSDECRAKVMGRNFTLGPFFGRIEGIFRKSILFYNLYSQSEQRYTYAMESP